MAARYEAAARASGNPDSIHLADRILGLTQHYLGNQALARQFTERALSEPRHIDAAWSIGFQVETPIAMTTLLARILWLQGFPDQAKAAAQHAIDIAQRAGHAFSLCYSLIIGGLPISLWTGDLDEAEARVDLLAAYGAEESYIAKWMRCFTRVIQLRRSHERDALIASFIELRIDISMISELAELVSGASLAMPLPGTEPVEELWNSPELLRVDAELLLWHDARDAAAEPKLVRALEIARRQAALPWELRSATSLGRLWHRHGRTAEARSLVAATCAKFTEGFDSVDLTKAHGLIAALDAGDPPI